MPIAEKKPAPLPPACSIVDSIFAEIEDHKKQDTAFFDMCRAREAGLATERDV
jgi:hypothetical protein